MELELEMSREMAGIKFSHPIMNGPGWACKTLEEVEVLARSMSSGILIGAVTVEAREGNTGETSYFDNPFFSVNSLGMANRGITYYQDVLTRMVSLAHDAGKPLGVNIAGFSAREFVALSILCGMSGVDWIELNLSCPNVHDKKNQANIFCFDSTLIDEIVLLVKGRVSGVPIGVKLSPYSNPAERERIARLLKNLEVDFVTLCNTFPDVLVYKPGIFPLETAISGKLAEKIITMGGYGGPALKPIALAHVKLFRKILHPWQGIIGIGGVQSGADVIEYEEAGANIVQLTTAHAIRQSKVFEQILSEYIFLRSSNNKP